MNKFFTKIAALSIGLAMAVGVGVAVGSGEKAVPVRAAVVTGTINFGSGSGSTNVNSATVTGNDSQNNSWTVTTVGTTSFTPNASYAQIGASKKPATSITFTTTLSSSQTISAFSAKFGGFSDTAGTITLKVGDTSVGTGSLNGTSDVVVAASNNTTTGTVLTVTVTGISKGVKAYYISYSYEEAVSSATLTNIVVSSSMTKSSYRTTDSWDPTGLVVTATYDDDSTKNVTSSVTWSYSPENPNSTSITSVVATASYTEGGVTKTASSSAQTVTISDKGASTNPYTVSEAWAICDALSSNSNNGEVVYVTGIVSGTVEINSYGGGTFDITDGTKTLKAYSISGVNNSDSTDPTYVADGYTVVITGAIIKFGSTYEVGYASGFSTSLVSSVAPASVSNIAVKTAPTKTAYKSGETFDATGLVITATYSDSSTQDVAYVGNEGSFTFSPETITTAGNVTITYRGKTCNQAVTLITVTSVTGVASAPSEVYQNKSISTSEVTLNVTYSDSSTGTVTPDSVTCDTSTLGNATATATYNAATGTKTATFNVTVKKEPVYDTIVDELVVGDTGLESTTYESWSGVEKDSGAVYAGSTNKNSNGGIGMRQDNAKDPSGIYTTASSGLATKVQITWTTSTTGRTLHIKGQDEPYTSIDYAGDITGTEIGSISYSSTSVNLSAEYKYICLYVTGGAAGFGFIKISWKVESAENPLVANPDLYIRGEKTTSTSVSVGKNIPVTIVTNPVESDEKLLISSSNTEIVTISSSGKTFVVRGVSIGSANVTVSGAKGTFKTVLTVTVIEASTTLEDKILTTANLNITGESYAVNNSADHDYDGVSFTSNNTQINAGWAFKAEDGYIANATPMHKIDDVAVGIKSITVYLNDNNEGEVTVYSGTEANPSTEVEISTSSTSDNVYSYSLSGATYFKVYSSGSKPLKLKAIIVELVAPNNTVVKEARDAAQTILTKLNGLCGDSGTGNVTQEKWNEINSAISGISSDAKLMLKEANRSYLINNIAQDGAIIENAMAHYDACVAKFGFTANEAISNAKSEIVVLNGLTNIDTTSTFAIVIISVISITAIGGFFFIRRKKEN